MTNSVHDPVCEMPVDPASGRSASHQERTFFFCSEYCRRFFLAHPDHYAGEPVAGDTSEELASRRLAYFSMEVGLELAQFGEQYARYAALTPAFMPRLTGSRRLQPKGDLS